MRPVRLRAALHKPHVLAFYRAECDALRNSLKARNLHRLDTIADDSKNDMARVASIKALEQISDIAGEKHGKPGAGQLPSLQIIIVQQAATSPVEPVLASHAPPK